MTNDSTAPSGDQAPPSPPAEAKPKTPFAAAAKVVRCTNLASVQFTGFSAQALEPTNTIPEGVTFEASTRFLRPTVTLIQGGFLTKTTLVFQVRSKPAEPDLAPKSYASIRATLEARYVLKPKCEFGDDELKDYALCYGPFHVWGYWREFVQSSLAKLDLPQFTLPLFLIHLAPQMVRDRVD